eukprot:TRINITY_DN14015_c0_g1_i1.p1 TRINITY_DN14015_c0_g1~~TRINITY_DN14015_c0_g1_i1.p1  ORF type:complete len:818 (+),score=208.92 TRINITY_DN14015_c0_g1_i1:82-2454(+)
MAAPELSWCGVVVPRPPSPPARGAAGPTPPGRWRRLSATSLRYRGASRQTQKCSADGGSLLRPTRTAAALQGAARAGGGRRDAHSPAQLRVACDALPRLRGLYRLLPTQRGGMPQWAAESAGAVLYSAQGRWLLTTTGPDREREAVRSAPHFAAVLPDRVRTWDMWDVSKWISSDEAGIDVAVTDTNDEPLRFTRKVTGQWGDLSPLAVTPFTLGGKLWPSVEHCYRAALFAGTPLGDEIAAAPTPAAARQLAQTAVQRRGPLSPSAVDAGARAMGEGTRSKFMQCAAARSALLSTGSRELVCADPEEPHWGTGADGEGENALGQLLLSVRSLAGDWERWPVPEPAKLEQGLVEVGGDGEWQELGLMSPARFSIQGETYASVEHYLQSQRFAGTRHEREVAAAESPAEARRMGLDPARPARSDWSRVRWQLLDAALQALYTQRGALRSMLLRTAGPIAAADADADACWAPECGGNVLGPALERVRAAELRVTTCRVRQQVAGAALGAAGLGQRPALWFLCSYPRFAPLDTRVSVLVEAESGFANAMADACCEMLEAEGAVVPAYLIRGNRLYPASCPAVADPCGPVARSEEQPVAMSHDELAEELPFPVQMSVLSLRGSEIRLAMEHHVAEVGSPLPLHRQRGLYPHLSGIRLWYDSTRPPGQRVVRILVGPQCEPLQELVSYRIAVPEPLSYGVRGVKPYMDRPRHDTPWSRTPLFDVVTAWAARRQDAPVALAVGGRATDLGRWAPSERHLDWRRPGAHRLGGACGPPADDAPADCDAADCDAAADCK